jgi:hypothetical protein
MQFMQQSYKDHMYETLESHRLTKRSVHFSDQGLNQLLAYRGSKDRRTATLDLKDASDRVHLHLVQRIFKTSGALEYLEDARSLHATLPNGKNIVLFKYASMGSALCFPVEACVFYTLIQSAMHILDGIRPSLRSIEKYSKLIDVYGDDIIVPVEYTDTIVRYLESYLLKVNINKSFKDSYFRESCGADFWKGVSVKPVYASELPHDDARDWGAKEVLSWNAKADIFYMEGKWLVAQAIRDMLRKVVKRPIPRARQPGSGIFHFSYIFTTGLRWNADLQCFKQKRIHYDPIKRKDSIDGDEIACLNKWGQRTHSQQRTRTGAHRRGDTAGYPRFGETADPSWRVRRTSDQCRMGQSDPDVDAWFRDRGICKLPGSAKDERTELPLVSAMVGVCDASGQGPTELPERDFGPDYCLTEVHSDPFGHLYGDSFGMDLENSVKRGSFKQKCRWVSLAS